MQRHLPRPLLGRKTKKLYHGLKTDRTTALGSLNLFEENVLEIYAKLHFGKRSFKFQEYPRVFSIHFTGSTSLGFERYSQKNNIKDILHKSFPFPSSQIPLGVAQHPQPQTTYLLPAPKPSASIDSGPGFSVGLVRAAFH